MDYTYGILPFFGHHLPNFPGLTFVLVLAAFVISAASYHLGKAMPTAQGQILASGANAVLGSRIEAALSQRRRVKGRNARSSLRRRQPTADRCLGSRDSISDEASEEQGQRASTGGPRFISRERFFLTKSEIGAIRIPIDGILSGASRPGHEILWLFDSWLNHNPRASGRPRKFFLIFSAVTL